MLLLKTGLMRKTIILLTCFFAVITANAQCLQNYKVNFPTDIYKLDAKSKATIDAKIKSLPNIPQAYIVRLSGHTDSVGSLDYNQQLSKNRVLTVSKYLKSKGFTVQYDSLSWHAYQKSIENNSSDENKGLNRRVEISVFAKQINPAIALGIKPKKETISCNAQQGGSFILKDGSKVNIPKDAFLDANGNIIKGNVDVNVTMYKSKLDVMLSGTQMSNINGNSNTFFETAGMFDFKATQNNKTVRINPKKELTLDLKTVENVTNYDLYTYHPKQLEKNKTNGKHWTLLNDSSKNNHLDFQTSFITHKTTNIRVEKKKKEVKKCGMTKSAAYLVAVNKSVELLEKAIPLSYENPSTCFASKLVADDTCIVRLHQMYVALNSSSFSISTYADQSMKYKGERLTPYIFNILKFISPEIKTKELFSNYQSAVLTKINGNEYKLVVTKQKKQHELLVMASYKGGKKFNSSKKLKQLSNIDLATILNTNMEASLNAKTNNIMLREHQEASRRLQEFYCASQQLMDTATGENKLNIKQWCTYFNEHKDIMEERFIKSDIKKSQTYLTNFSIENPARGAFGKDGDAAVSAFASFGIKTNGIYNADACSSMKEPMIVEAVYFNENKTEIKPIFSYVYIKGINTAIRFDGYCNLNPYKFKISKNSAQCVFLFDGNGKAYICTPQYTEKAMMTKGTKTFIVKEITNIGDEDKLDELSKENDSVSKN